MSQSILFKKTDAPADAVMLFIAGTAMSVAGILLFPISVGSLAYYEKGLYGLLMFIWGLQMVMLGRTPFGDVNRTNFLIGAGTIFASAGIVTCIIPDVFGKFPGAALSVCFAFGGFAQLMQLFFPKNKFHIWMGYGGVFARLTYGCIAVYSLSMFIGALVWRQSLIPLPAVAASVTCYGMSIIFLSVILKKIYRLYPAESAQSHIKDGFVGVKPLLLITGVFTVLLGVLLIPVNLGLLPFSRSAQLGLLTMIMAIRMLAFGDTPLGSFRRNVSTALTGTLLAVLGTVSCMIPEIMISSLTFTIAVLNISEGIINLLKNGPAFLKNIVGRHNFRYAVLIKLYLPQFIMAVLSIIFGLSMFIPSLIPAYLAGAVLAANGIVVLYFLYTLHTVEKQ
jgi:hypothetical protein